MLQITTCCNMENMSHSHPEPHQIMFDCFFRACATLHNGMFQDICAVAPILSSKTMPRMPRMTYQKDFLNLTRHDLTRLGWRRCWTWRRHHCNFSKTFTQRLGTDCSSKAGYATFLSKKIRHDDMGNPKRLTLVKNYIVMLSQMKSPQRGLSIPPFPSFPTVSVPLCYVDVPSSCFWKGTCSLTGIDQDLQRELQQRNKS